MAHDKMCAAASWIPGKGSSALCFVDRNCGKSFYIGKSFIVHNFMLGRVLFHLTFLLGQEQL